MDPVTLNQLRLQVIQSFFAHCAALSQRAMDEEVEASFVLQELAWLSARCHTLCTEHDAAHLQSVLGRGAASMWEMPYKQLDASLPQEAAGTARICTCSANGA